MVLDQSFIGRTYPPGTPYQVSREKIAEFATAIGDTSALSRDPEVARTAGHPDVVAPPTFLTILTLGVIDKLATDPDLGLDYSRMVHGDQSFTHHRPATAGDRLTVTTTIEDIFARAGNDFLTVRAEIADDAGEPVCTAKAQLVVRGEDA
ncbi:MaoC family dehydratase N-terminal domain-containing protein [Haloechinothrix halophila]|uniref:MaoC family dehydratase N-terminal domain-containing protein n=1 Tax=Haloechinothrix halophila TaxID=1069073 RepID=UPI0004115C05|nr:MaoC family dehydratase N-terminal domain-containing protein [Haloechinothrix halophila]